MRQKHKKGNIKIGNHTPNTINIKYYTISKVRFDWSSDMPVYLRGLKEIIRILKRLYRKILVYIYE